jgi:hypothetical protein
VLSQVCTLCYLLHGLQYCKCWCNQNLCTKYHRSHIRYQFDRFYINNDTSTRLCILDSVQFSKLVKLIKCILIVVIRFLSIQFLGII